ncbi:MAG: hypothetical protein KKA07_14190, partial [Bacteroidetes bacterium]|nr:hypothetical protein [Bacteroidota bacterium]
MRNRLFEHIEAKKSGTARSVRQHKALDPGYFQVDERTLTDFIDFTGKYAGLISFYNQSNNPDGDWSTFFENDVSMLLIQLS